MYNTLKKIRKQNGYNIKKMSEKLGISSSYYSQIESQARGLSYDMAVRISMVLKTKPDVIFYDEHIANKDLKS